MILTQLEILNEQVQLTGTISLSPGRTPQVSYASYSLVRQFIMHSYNKHI